MNNTFFRSSDGVMCLIGVNLFVYLIAFAFTKYDLDALLSLYNPMNDRFRTYQLLTHMFIHSKRFVLHILLNMLALWMFGTKMEPVLGARRFLTVYFLSGFLAAFFQILFNMGVIVYFAGTADLSWMESPLQGEMTETQRILLTAMYAPMMGASGAVGGVVGAFARFFPNYRVFIFPIPFPIAVRKALGFFVFISFVSALFNLMPGVAHFAHIGGVAGGFFLGGYYLKKYYSNQ